MQLNNETRTKILLGLLVSVGIFEFLDAITSSITLFYINQLFQGIEAGYEWFNFLERYESVSGISIALLYVLGIVFLCWIYKAHQNLDTLGRSHLRFSHSSTVWWWFVPLFNLWKPYQVLKEILLKTTENLKDDKAKKVQYVLCVYWLISIPLNIYATFVFRFFYKPILFSNVEMSLSDYQFLYLNVAIINVFALILTFCLFYYIYHINRWQQNSKSGVSLQKKTI